MNKKIKIILIIVFILFLSIGSTIAFLHEDKTEKKDDLLLIRCQGDSCTKDVTTTTKKVSTTSTTTTQVVNQTTTTTKVTPPTLALSDNSNNSNNDNRSNNNSSNNNNNNTPNTNSGNNTPIVENNTTDNTTVVENTIDNNSSTNTQIVNTQTSNNDVVIHDDETINVKDDKQIWNQSTTLNLLEPGEYLVPGKHGTYDFSVDNIVDEDVTYMAKFTENNKYNANMLYKLKRNDEYIAGNDDEWVHFESMSFKNRTLASGETDDYHLEWAWIDAPNDTEVGRSENPTYSFNMFIMAYEEIDYNPNNPEQDDENLGQGEGDVEEAVEPGFIIFNPKTGDEIYIYMTLVFMSLIGLMIVKHSRGN